MAKTLMHDAGRGDEIRRRVRALQPTTTPSWGKMTVDQMLHHVNLVLLESLGEYRPERSIRGLPPSLVRYAILNLPWGKGAPTRPDMVIPAGQRYDFATEQSSCLSMIDRFLAQPMDAAWPRSANFPMTGRHWSQLQYRHLNHHLTQFGV
ncbi:MAG TPA: hypothetical protein VE967_14745 [Gemmatimonadaceae bacterium]|nr:hypothetical protein [Gemmatimonadaceae bacterium]